MSKILHLVLSDTTFGGFEHYVPLTPDMTLADLIPPIVERLREVLTLHKLEDAKIALQTKHFHIHGHSLEDLRTNAPDTIYVCHHD